MQEIRIRKAALSADVWQVSTLFTEGGKIGPNLTGFKRDDIRGILMNVINPSAEIRKGFENYTVLTESGRIVTGFIADQDNQVVVLEVSTARTWSSPR
ncbi:MAG: hypothetical protein Ct9H300mP1_12990 [Planctomycetaceae bacterium]|nr:MAG: hypothetical protein Ct9H300mP1_12990 [Planctomycetaceae bacterium]